MSKAKKPLSERIGVYTRGDMRGIRPYISQMEEWAKEAREMEERCGSQPGGLRTFELDGLVPEVSSDLRRFVPRQPRPGDPADAG